MSDQRRNFFRKKPVVVEAMQFDGNNLADLLVFIGVSRDSAEGCALNPHMPLIIETLEGDMTASVGDWVHPRDSRRALPVQARRLRRHVRTRMTCSVRLMDGCCSSSPCPRVERGRPSGSPSQSRSLDHRSTRLGS